jgi:hypothetical protein
MRMLLWIGVGIGLVGTVSGLIAIALRSFA